MNKVYSTVRHEGDRSMWLNSFVQMTCISPCADIISEIWIIWVIPLGRACKPYSSPDSALFNYDLHLVTLPLPTYLLPADDGVII